MGGLAVSLFLEKVTFFSRLQFLEKKKKKTKIAEIFNEKKFINKNVLLCHN